MSSFHHMIKYIGTMGRKNNGCDLCLIPLLTSLGPIVHPRFVLGGCPPPTTRKSTLLYA
jgi:hypothetical protein